MSRRGITRPLLDRLNVHVIRGQPDECWGWKGSTNRGYGQLYVNPGELYAPTRRPILAHIVAYILLVGDIPPGYQIDHTCHNGTDCPGGDECPHRRCTNPRHLEVITAAENKRRGNSRNAINARKAHCVHGHEFTKENTEMRERADGGVNRRCRQCHRDEAVTSNAKARAHRASDVEVGE